MLLKYVANSPIVLEDFKTEKNEEIELYPGDTVDLSHYSQIERDSSMQLRTMFEKGDMICVGPGKKVEQQKQLIDKAELRHQQLKLGKQNNFAGQYKVKGINKREVPLFSLDKRKHVPKIQSSQRYTPQTDKYFDQFKESTEKTEQSEDQQIEEQRAHSFVQIQNEDQIQTFKWNHGNLEVQQAPGVIQFNPKKSGDVFVDTNDYNKNEEAKYSVEKAVEASKEIVQKKIEGKCMSMTAQGSPCKNTVMQGYEYCWQHLPRKLRIEYIKKNKQKFFGTKEVNK